jgi:putative ABC transport system permease protein
MKRIQWLVHVILASLCFRAGRTLLLLAVIAMASSLAVSLGTVTFSMERRITEEVRRYGANLLLMPDTARMDLGSGGLAFGSLTEPAYLEAAAVERLLSGLDGRVKDHSLHLRVPLLLDHAEVPAEGVRFNEVRRMLPWWEPAGSWPVGEDEVIIGAGLARRFKLAPGARIALDGPAGSPAAMTVAGVVSTGGEEDGLLFLDLARMQAISGLGGRVSQVRLMAETSGSTLPAVAAALEQGLPGARAREVRQITRTSDALLKKVQLLMGLVTVVVLAASAASVTGTMSTTILERGREIGLIKAMGATRRGVVLLFAAEACVLGLAGGLAGWAAGVMIAETVSRSVFAVSSGFTLLAVPVSIATGLLIAFAGSVGPMLSVYRLDPVQSLKGE